MEESYTCIYERSEENTGMQYCDKLLMEENSDKGNIIEVVNHSYVDQIYISFCHF